MSQNEFVFFDTINHSLKKITKGSVIIFVGTIIGVALSYISKILIGRFFTPTEYGIFSLGFVLVNLFTMLSLLGLQEGTSRQVAYYRGRKDFLKIKRIIFSSLFTVFLSSLILSAVLFFLSNFISINIFHNPLLSRFLQIFIVSIPFFSLIYILISIARGFDRTKESAYFQNILRNCLFLVFLILIIVFTFPFKYVIYSFVLSMIITCLALISYTKKKAFYLGNKPRQLFPKFKFIDRELLLFSLPLLGVNVLDYINSSLDTLMLGFFQDVEQVGIYNSAFPFVKFIPLILTSAAFIYVPIVTKLYSKDMKNEVKRIYVISTKWIFLMSFPIFLIIFLFPEALLMKFFGINYIQAAVPLQILALGFLIHIFFGLNGMTLLALGETKFLMKATLASTIIGVILNMLLIPTLGMIGAAIATVTIFLIFNLFRSAKLYFSYQIHPFTKRYIKPTLVMILISSILYWVIKDTNVSWWMLPTFFIFSIILAFLSVLSTKSIELEEISMCSLVGKKIGINPLWIEKILQKFT